MQVHLNLTESHLSFMRPLCQNLLDDPRNTNFALHKATCTCTNPE